MKLLEIQSSPRGESSDSITLTKLFIEACKSGNNSIVVDTLNVWHESLPEFDYEAIGAKYKAVKHETMTEAESNVWERIQLLIQRFQNADRIVLGTPMWNFGLPYDGKQYGPLLNVEKAIVETIPMTAPDQVLISGVLQSGAVASVPASSERDCGKPLLTVQTLTYMISSCRGRGVTRREVQFWRPQRAS